MSVDLPTAPAAPLPASEPPAAPAPPRFAWLPSLRTFELAALALISIGALIGFLIYPVYPNYDSMYSLLWGREILDGQLPGFDDYRAPTEHPLWLAMSVLLVPLGEGADRVLVAICVASFVASVAGLYRLGKAVFSPLVGAVAAALLLTRLDFPYLAARGYVDIAYLALLMWAAVLEIERPKRGGWVWVLLACCGLLRPEGWVFAGLYALYLGWNADWSRRFRVAAYAAVGPAIWAVTDLVVTGDPMYSLNYTTESARQLGRRQEWWELPEVTIHYLADLTKWPVLVAAVIGVGLAVWLARSRMLVPMALLIVGMAVFIVSSLRGFSVIARYLMPGALVLMLFAAFALAGSRWLPGDSRLRRWWGRGAIVLAVLAAGFSATHFDTRYIDRELNTRDSVRTQLDTLLDHPAVQAGRRCGPVTVPNHKLVPDVRWLLDASASQVTGRTTLPQGGMLARGVAIYLHGTLRFLRHPAYGPFDQSEDTPLIQVPGPGAVKVASTRNFSAYVTC